MTGECTYTAFGVKENRERTKETRTRQPHHTQQASTPTQQAKKLKGDSGKEPVDFNVLRGDKKREACGNLKHDKAFRREVRHDWRNNDVVEMRRSIHVYEH
jgi:hypothetical protein